jgi:TPR repeat protein
MKKLFTTLCLTLTLLLGSASMSWSADFQKGLAAADRGDFATALREWKPLAEQGDATAQYNLGVMYDKGQGVPKDYKTAVKWYKLVAEQGYAVAQSNLGVMYANGEGIPQDYKTAMKWYRLSAKQGFANAQSNLGLMYVNGTGVLQDYARAHMWWNIAASSGDKDAVINRDLVAKRMTPSQIEIAQKLARECVRKQYKGC